MNFNDINDLFNNFVKQNNSENKKDNILDKYGRNLTLLAENNDLDPVINRDNEIRRMIRILSRKTKNNPILVGEPGVGKTAIVEGLAKKIIDGQVPENLKNKKVYELDITSLIAGASYQGEFEKRIKNVLKEIENSNGNIILFIDEIHMLIGTGKNSEGGMDAANIFKPLMARGKLHLIGATTFEEYRKYIEKDSAFERRLQKIDINEPTVNDSITILRGLKERLENFHNVKIEDSALIKAVELSYRYINDRFLPDKAIDLVDEAAATIKTEINFLPEELDKAKQRLTSLQMEKIALESDKYNLDKEKINEIEKIISNLESKIKLLTDNWNKEKKRLSDISILRKKLENAQHMLNIAQNESNYETASKLMYVEIPKLEKEIELKEVEEKNDPNKLIKNTVTTEEITNIVSKWTGIPLNKLLDTEKEKLLNLNNELKKIIIGQDDAIDKIYNSILRAKANINDPNRPLASFMFLGPTGVGKTELAKQLANKIFNSEKEIIRLDMSEFMEKHSVSKIIGAPPGYIGFDYSNTLCERIRKKPYAILLLDEIEKAHKDVLNILLQILDNGEITDSKGRKINCKNLIIIMTSNLGSEEILKKKLNQNKINEFLIKYLTPEFINRIDEIIIFNQLTEDNIRNIVKNELTKLSNRLSEKKYFLSFSDNLITYISKNSYTFAFGARPIKRFIQDKIETFLATQIIKNQIKLNNKYLLNLNNDKIELINI
ncbi:AAA family ATPase [Mycoplasma sp. 744]|uniref:ATP-dependent Clp protease ATP-binding subunit n=1 Tax=Mycoplasma sp. 744 TaxID=3108531 RepID=UPI002B1E86DA|nr:AAA family ATPase [Mycoplasma sp. 744]MEA4115305.1 AAA family ATPase [Mycoplasma sp. 744]